MKCHWVHIGKAAITVCCCMHYGQLPEHASLVPIPHVGLGTRLLHFWQCDNSREGLSFASDVNRQMSRSSMVDHNLN